MAYTVIPFKGHWYLRHDTYLPGGKRKQRRVPKAEYSNIGFAEEMSFEQARERAHQLSANETLLKQEAKRQRIKERLQEEQLREAALLVMENEFLQLLTSKREQTQWRAARRVVLAIPVQLEHWEEAKLSFYRYFSSEGISADYAWRLLKLVNRYGKFVAIAHRRPFSPVPMPRGLSRQQITDEAEDCRAAPLRPQHLEAVKDKFSTEQYNWLYVSVWLGLRPEEIDHPVTFEMHEGIRCMKVYQSKLVRLKKEERNKIIPCLFEEQKKAFEIMETRQLKRPLVKTMEKYLGEGYGVYSGRKGFVKLMKGRGRQLEEISAWMGHRDMNRTREEYEEKNQLIINK